MFGARAACLQPARALVEDMYMSAQAAGAEVPAGVRLGRYLPLSIGVTAVVTAVPLILVSQLGPARSAPAVALHVLAAVVAVGGLGPCARGALDPPRAVERPRLRRPAAVGLGAPGARRAPAQQRDARDRGADGARRGPRHAAAPDERPARSARPLHPRPQPPRGAPRRADRPSDGAAARAGGQDPRPRSCTTSARSTCRARSSTSPASSPIRSSRSSSATPVTVRPWWCRSATPTSPRSSAITTSAWTDGLPDRLAGDDIPIGARVIAVADTFDAITSARAPRLRARTSRRSRSSSARRAPSSTRSPWRLSSATTPPAGRLDSPPCWPRRRSACCPDSAGSSRAWPPASRRSPRPPAASAVLR